MPKYSLDELDRRLGAYLAPELPERPSSDVNLALRVAGLLESKGYSFQLKDLCPKSLSESLWQAVFSAGDARFVAEDCRSAVAVCTAALAALQEAEVA